MLARIWKKRHFRHHYADSSRDFGVSNPLWDVVFGTKSTGKPGATTRPGRARHRAGHPAAPSPRGVARTTGARCDRSRRR